MENSAVNLKQIAVAVHIDDGKIQLKNMVGTSPVDFVDCEVDDAFLKQNVRSYQAILTYNLLSLYVKQGYVSFSSIAGANFYMEDKISVPTPEISESGLYCVADFWLDSKTTTIKVKATFDRVREAKNYAKELAETSSEPRYYGVFVLDTVYIPTRSVQVEHVTSLVV